MPEVDLPGHAYATLVAYPEPAIEPPPGCKLGRDVLAVQRPEFRRFVRDVLDEIMALNMPVILCPNSHFYFDYPQEPQSAAPGEHVITT